MLRLFQRFHANAVAKTTGGSVTLSKILYTQDNRVAAETKVTGHKIAYGQMTLRTRARATLHSAVAKLIRGRKAVTAYVAAKAPFVIFARWRILEELDEAILFALDDTVLENLDYINLDELDEAQQEGDE